MAIGGIKKIVSYPAVKTLVHEGAKKLMNSGIVEKAAHAAINKAAEFAAKKGVPEALINGAKGTANKLVQRAMEKAPAGFFIRSARHFLTILVIGASEVTE